MPIDSNNLSWEDAIADDSLQTTVKQYLRAHEDKAYNVRELADMFLGTKWERKLAKEVALESKERQPFHRNHQEEGDENKSGTQNMRNFVIDSMKTARLQVILDTLVANEVVETKRVPVEAIDLSYGRDYVRYYTYAGE